MSQNKEMLEAVIKAALEEGLSRNTYETNEDARKQLYEYEESIEENDIGEKSFMMFVARETEMDHEELMYSDLRSDTKEALSCMELKKEHLDDRVALYQGDDEILIPFLSKKLFDFTIGHAYHLLGYFPKTPTKDDIRRCFCYARRVMEKTVEEFTKYYRRLEEIL